MVKKNIHSYIYTAGDKLVGKLDAQSARIAERLNLDDRIEKLAKKEAFITLKGHKPTFHDNPTCRLINPTKSEIGVISKQILDEINTSIINSTRINQWKNTSSVLKWFNSLENKERLSFICFDVCEFYPSITEKLLSKALDFASKYRKISKHERDIILFAKRSLLLVFSVTPFKIDQINKSKPFNRLSPESGNRKNVDMQGLSPRFRSQ